MAAGIVSRTFKSINDTFVGLFYDTGTGLAHYDAGVGTPADTKATNSSDSWSVISFLRAFFDNQASILTKLDTLQATVSGTLANSEIPAIGVIDMPTQGASYTAGRAVEIIATVSGDVTLTYSDNSTRTRRFSSSGGGLTRLPDAVIKWSVPNGSSFVGTVCNLK